MGLFDIFKKQKKFDLPEMYNGIISKDEHNIIMEICIKYHNDNELIISKIDEGEIVTDIDGNEQHSYLDNLVRVLASNDKTIWNELIYEHFDKLKPNPSALNYLYKDFEYASQFLRVLLKEDTFNLGDKVENFVNRIDFPKTNTFLILEFEGQFYFVRKDEIIEWDKTENDLFECAIQNLPEDEIEVKEYEFGEKFTVFIFFSGDYSASLMLDLKNRADYTIGKFGTLIAIPTKGTAYAHPIDTSNILELIEILDPTIEKFYNEDPGNVTTNFYWYYDDKIQIFPTEQSENGILISLPKDLINLINETE
jgi:hypothetical protein